MNIKLKVSKYVNLIISWCLLSQTCALKKNKNLNYDILYVGSCYSFIPKVQYKGA